MILYRLAIELLAMLAIVLYGWPLGKREGLARDRGDDFLTKPVRQS